MLVDTLPEKQQTTTQEQLFVPKMKVAQTTQPKNVEYETSIFEKILVDYFLTFGAWALRPKNLERIIVYGSCTLFFIVIGLLSVYLAGFGSEYQ